MSATSSGGRRPRSTATGAEQAVDWSTRSDGGFAEFRAARERLLQGLRVQSEIYQLECAWSMPVADGVEGD